MSTMLYTYGYTGTRPADLLAQAQHLDAAVLDIRYRPLSQWAPVWNRGRLADLLGGRYRHCGLLGNLNYKNGGPIELADPEAGLIVLADLLTSGPVILLCKCHDWQTCHRRTVAELAAARLGVAVEHLSPPALTSEPPTAAAPAAWSATPPAKETP